MSFSAEFIDALLRRLKLRYGSAFLARREDWTRELTSYAERPGAIEHALTLLDPAEPPTAAHFRDLCRSAPTTTQAQRAAEIRRKYLHPVAPQAGRERAWAAEMVQRACAGGRVPRYSLRLALDALKRPGSPF